MSDQPLILKESLVVCTMLNKFLTPLVGHEIISILKLIDTLNLAWRASIVGKQVEENASKGNLILK